MSFNLFDMERGELCHNRCVCLLLDDYVQDVGAAKLDAKTRCAGSELKSGVWVAWMGCKQQIFMLVCVPIIKKLFLNLKIKCHRIVFWIMWIISKFNSFVNTNQ